MITIYNKQIRYKSIKSKYRLDKINKMRNRLNKKTKNNKKVQASQIKYICSFIIICFAFMLLHFIIN